MGNNQTSTSNRNSNEETKLENETLEAEALEVEPDRTKHESIISKAGSLYLLGNNCFRRKEFDAAKEYYTNALRVLESDNNSKKMNVDNTNNKIYLKSSSLSNLGIIRFSEGAVKEAKKLHQKALDVCSQEKIKFEENLSPDIIGLKQLTGKLRHDRSCAPRHQNLSTLITKLEWEDRKDARLADTLNNLGACLELEGDFEGAVESYRQALTLRLVIFGKRSLKTAECYSNLGLALDTLGLLEEAEKNICTAIKIHESLLGKDSTESTVLLNNYGVLLCHLGRFDDSENILKEVVQLRTKAYGESHFFTSCASRNLEYVRNRRANSIGIGNSTETREIHSNRNSIGSDTCNNNYQIMNTKHDNSEAPTNEDTDDDDGDERQREQEK